LFDDLIMTDNIYYMKRALLRKKRNKRGVEGVGERDFRRVKGRLRFLLLYQHGY
jgi:hypothetical protein